jgi:murein DD-endopeptidase MepM/ murein hydrolase activator NlpD
MGSHRADHRASTRSRPHGNRRATPASTAGVPTVTTEIPVLEQPVAGKRRAAKQTGGAPRARIVGPSLRAALGVSVLAVAAGGVITAPDVQAPVSAETRVMAPTAMNGTHTSGSFAVLDRGKVVSRDSDRDALEDAAGGDLAAEAEKQAQQRDAKLGQLAKAAEKEAGEINENAWVLPLLDYRLTARFGEYGLWASSHTGLDFAAPSGTPIRAVAGGTVTFAGYDGSYGNKTVVTLEDGTELWYAHQTSFGVSAGDTVRSGEVIGYVGSTGNSTGSHLHLEVRPGAGDPVDPYAALIANGVNP